MKKLIFLLSLIPLTFYSCKNTDKKEASETSTEMESASDTMAVSINGNFYQQYQGTLGGNPIVVQFVRFDDDYNLNYVSPRTDGHMDLYYQPDSIRGTDSLFFIEMDRGGIYGEDQQDPSWRVALTPSGLHGTWVSGDQKTRWPIDLKPVINDSIFRFDVIGYNDSLIYPGFTKAIPKAHAKMALLQPSDPVVQGDWFTAAVNQRFLHQKQTQPGSNLSRLLHTVGYGFLTSFKDDVDSFKADFKNETEIPFSFLNYEQLMNTNLMLNQNGYAVLRMTDYTYTGGAHGLQGQTLLCLDMAAKKVLDLSDILSIDSVKLQQLLETRLREKYKIPTDKPLSTVLFEKHLALTQNFYFTSQGIGFIYQPYEIAAYVMGNIDLWLPYQVLKPYLLPAFSKRMGL